MSWEQAYVSITQHTRTNHARQAQKQGDSDDAAVHGKGKLAEVMQSLEELWDEEQYNEEFNVSGFVASLPGASARWVKCLLFDRSGVQRRWNFSVRVKSVGIVSSISLKRALRSY